MVEQVDAPHIVRAEGADSKVRPVEALGNPPPSGVPHEAPQVAATEISVEIDAFPSRQLRVTHDHAAGHGAPEAVVVLSNGKGGPIAAAFVRMAPLEQVPAVVHSAP